MSSAGTKPIGPPTDTVARKPGIGCSSCPAEQGVGVGRVQGLRPGREVEHPRAAVGDDERHRQRRVYRPVAEPQEEELDVGVHAGRKGRDAASRGGGGGSSRARITDSGSQIGARAHGTGATGSAGSAGIGGGRSGGPDRQSGRADWTDPLDPRSAPMSETRPVLEPGPDHPITIERFVDHVVVRQGSVVIAETDRALAMREASYAPSCSTYQWTM